jgi:hypothetical protein
MHADKGNANTRFGRLKALGAGLIFIAVGILRMLGGVQVVTHGTGQPMFFLGTHRSRNRLHSFRSRSCFVDHHGSEGAQQKGKVGSTLSISAMAIFRQPRADFLFLRCRPIVLIVRFLND